MYKYKNMNLAQPGDVVEYTNASYIAYTKGNLYVVKEDIDEFGVLATELDDRGSTTNGANIRNFKLLDTNPGSQAKKGDEVIVIKHINDTYPIGSIIIVSNASDGSIRWNNGSAAWYEDYFKVLQKDNSQTIEVGDTVRYIGPKEPDVPRPEQCVIKYITGNWLYYADGFGCNIKYWELVSKKPQSREGEFFTKTKQQKEEPVKDCKVNNEVVSTNSEPIEVKTDLESVNKTLCQVYTPSGELNETLFISKKGAKKLLQKPAMLGHTIVVYERKAVLTTEVPIKETK